MAGWCYIVLLLVSITNASALLNYRVGVVMVEKSVLPFKMEMVGPALDIAFDVAEKDFGVHFETFVRLYPDWCNAVYTTGAISDLYHNHSIHGLIGPGCSGDITVCGKLATYYKLPQVTGVGDLVLGKEDYPTLTRLSYSLEKQSVFLTALLNNFEWKHIAIIFDIYDVLMRIQGSALRTALREDPSYPRPYDIEFDTTKNPDFEEMLLEASQHARVILFLSSGDDLRKFMLTAFDLGMTTSGEYAFITIELFRSEAWGDFSWKRDDARDNDAKTSFESLLFITLTVPSGPKWDNFSQAVIEGAKSTYNYTFEEEVNYFIGAFYDSVIYLARALNQTLEDEGDPFEGLSVAQKLWNKTFEGIMGDVYIDDIGDRIADYSLLDMTYLENGTFEIVANFYGARQVFVLEEGIQIHWPGTGKPPPDVPDCGFKGDDPKCSKEKLLIAALSAVAAVCVIACLIGYLVYRRVKFEAGLADMSWKVAWDDVILNKARSMASTSRLSLAVSEAQTGDSGTQDGIAQIFTTIGNYKGAIVAVRKMPAVKFVINRQILLELKQIRELHHDNLVRFVGASVEPDHVAILTEYCPKGSLLDILANDAIKLDWTFRYSLTNDIVRGMVYLHGSSLQVHGRLKSANCVVDSRFVLKLTDFGLPSFYQAESQNGEKDKIKHAYFRQKFWRAPELLSTERPADQMGDVYSFGIILQEIITRAEPYEDYDISPEEVIKRVQHGETPPFRPKVDRSLCTRELYDVMERCWAESAQARPSFAEIRHLMRNVSKESKTGGNILDNLLSRMEQYAENLESLVEERTRAFLDEKKKSEELLYRVLPKSIAEELKQGKSVQPEAYECVTIYFSDIVGFTALSAASTPMQVIDLLNDLYTCFDAIIGRFDVYKVETIGDAYMVVSGLPIKNGNEHARQICRMSLHLLNAVKVFRVRHRPGENLKLRIGIHSGPCCAGVVGLTMPRYCLFGDTVNTASRMESNGEPLKIHVSPFTVELLEKFASFQLEERGEVAMKGKGTMVTYWLNGEDQG